MVHRVAFIIYPGFELLDVAGPLAVFSTATQLSGQDLYAVGLHAPRAPVRCSAGVEIAAAPIGPADVATLDTVLFSGAYGGALRRAAADPELLEIARAASRVSRFGSVCTGTFILAAADVVGGRRVATHWQAVAPLRAMFGRIEVDDQALYVTDGRLWTSAGVTTGIDMALAMLGADHGKALAGSVAKQLVVYAHRPGHQSQFSGIVDLQTGADGQFGELLDWLQERLDQPVPVAEMAARCGMSERTFARRFFQVTGRTPARCLDELRIERARRLLEAGEPVKSVAARVGYASEAAFRSSFTKRHGVGPAQYSRMHVS